MPLTLRRTDSIHGSLDLITLDGTPGVFDDVYLCETEEGPRWQAATSWGENANVPFREELVWASAGVAVIGGGGRVYFLDLDSGQERSRLDMPCLFGHFVLDAGGGQRTETLYVLGWTDIIAVKPTLETKWSMQDVAVDGVTFKGADGAALRFAVEMDPPGGWFEVEVDAATGRELSRTSAFTDGYEGIYARHDG